ncbi:hypothetical protein [Neptunomonas sp.]|uniref:hypothetical protein n=1 Tax=Neptunomonas sp. TaxID=1971898 RepID=UPI0025EE62DF|nr:hypothetical protein [Neptunomonas sp.]
MKHAIPDWVTRGKTIKQLIEELKSFEDQDMEVRLSLDDGDTHACISLVTNDDKSFCILKNSEAYHQNEWQDFMDDDEKR